MQRLSVGFSTRRGGAISNQVTEDLARRIDRSPAYITKIFRGNFNFTLDFMVKIALALDCTYRSHLEPAECGQDGASTAETAKVLR